jgi:hypothetical protein
MNEITRRRFLWQKAGGHASERIRAPPPKKTSARDFIHLVSPSRSANAANNAPTAAGC